MKALSEGLRFFIIKILTIKQLVREHEVFELISFIEILRWDQEIFHDVIHFQVIFHIY